MRRWGRRDLSRPGSPMGTWLVQTGPLSAPMSGERGWAWGLKRARKRQALAGSPRLVNLRRCLHYAVRMVGRSEIFACTIFYLWLPYKLRFTKFIIKDERIMMKRTTIGIVLAYFVIATSSLSASSCKLHYTLKSGAKGVQSGYSSYAACMKAGNGSASFADKIESFYCECSG